MNAYELAKYIEDDIQIQEGIADMLCEQADRIAELEKRGKPVAWMSPDGKVSQTEGKLFYIPLYTTPQTKPLSDEEINLLKAEIAAHKKTNELLSQKIIELQEDNKK